MTSARTATPKLNQNQPHAPPRTPQSSSSSKPQQRLLNFNTPRSASAHPSPNPNSTTVDHPVEVIGRIRDYFTDKKKKKKKKKKEEEEEEEENPERILQVNPPNSETIRVRTEIGYRDFVLDGVSLSEDEDLEGFYKRFVEGRIRGVKVGGKCTIMMYGPTGSGKSHTMFGGVKQQGIVYRSLKEILGEEEDGSGGGGELGVFVQVSVLEIYNEEIYDLLTSNGGAPGLPKGGSASKVTLWFAFNSDFLVSGSCNVARK